MDDPGPLTSAEGDRRGAWRGAEQRPDAAKEVDMTIFFESVPDFLVYGALGGVGSLLGQLLEIHTARWSARGRILLGGALLAAGGLGKVAYDAFLWPGGEGGEVVFWLLAGISVYLLGWHALALYDGRAEARRLDAIDRWERARAAG